MTEQTRLAFHHTVRAFILAAFAYYVSMLVKQDNLHMYIAPRMTFWVKGAAVALFLIAAHQLYLALGLSSRKAIDCDCDHPKPRGAVRNLSFYGLFLIPLLFGFLTPDKLLGSAIIDKKGIQLSAAGITQNSAAATKSGTNVIVKDNPPAGTGDEKADPPTTPTAPTANAGSGSSVSDAKLDEMFKTDEYNEDFATLGKRMYKQNMITVKDSIFMETLTSLDLFKNAFVGKNINIGGFVYRPDDMKGDQFVIARFAMSCCSADASPYGVIVDYPGAERYAKDTWIKITGTIGTTTYNGNEVMQIKATKIESIKPAESPYVYPNFDFLSDTK